VGSSRAIIALYKELNGLSGIVLAWKQSSVNIRHNK
jgi:hypothetical protein